MPRFGSAKYEKFFAIINYLLLYRQFSGFLPLLEIRENWKAFFQSGKSQGIWHFLKKIRGKLGNFDDTIFFLYFDDTIYFHGCRERITAGCVGLRYLYS